MWDIILTVFIFAIVILLWICIYDSNRFITVELKYSDKRIKENFRAVVLADLHNKQYGKGNTLLLDAIREKKPDVILIAGDMITAVPRKSMEPGIHLVQELAKEYPVYYGNGNHEYRMKIYPDTYGNMAETLDRELERAGVIRLVNDAEFLEKYGVVIYGAEIDKKYYKRFRVQQMPETYLPELLGNADKECCSVLLAHHPDYFPQYAAWGADLTFSGHVHGGVVRVPFWGKGVISPAIRFFPKYDGGIFKIGDAVMAESRGLGSHTIPVRLFNPGELLVVDFEQQNT